MQCGRLVVLLAAKIGGRGAGRALEPVIRGIPGVVAGGSGGGIARVPSLAARRPGAAGFRDRCRRDRGGRHRVRARSRHVDQCRRLRRTGYIIAAVIVLLVLGDALGWFVGWFGGARHRPAYPPRGPARPRRSRGRPAAAPGPGSGALGPTMTVLALDGYSRTERGITPSEQIAMWGPPPWGTRLSTALTSWHLGSAKRGHGGMPRDLSPFAAALRFRAPPDQPLQADPPRRRPTGSRSLAPSAEGPCSPW